MDNFSTSHTDLDSYQEAISTKMWWEYKNTPEDREKLLTALNTRGDMLEKDMELFRRDYKKFLTFYEDSPTLHQQFKNRNLLGKSWNLLRVAVDAHFNRVAKITPRVTFLTKGCKIIFSQLATKVDDWIFHLFNEGDIHEESRDAYKDCLIGALGHQKIVPDEMNKSFKFRRILPFCISYEKPYEGSNRRSEILETSMIKYYDIEKMIKTKSTGKLRDELMKMLKESHGSNKDALIKVREITKATEKTAVWTERVILKFDDWKYDWIPYLNYIWDKKNTGVVGTSVAELVTPAQRKCNGMLYRIDRNTEMFTNQYIVLPRNSGFAEMDNGFGRFYEANLGSTGEGKPMHITPPIMHDQVFNHLHDTYKKGLEVARLSDLQTEGRVPIGMNQGSGKALKYYNDIDTSKFFVPITLYEKNYLKAAKICLEWGCDLYPKESPFKEVIPMKKDFMKKVSKFAEGVLPDTPSGRLDVLERLVGIGAVKKEKFMELLDAPDVAGFLRSESARVQAITKYLETNFYENKPASLDPVLGYEEQKEIALSIYARVVKESDEGIDDQKLDNIRVFLAQCKEAQEKIKQEQARFIAGGGQFGGETPANVANSPDPNKTSEPGGGGGQIA